MLDKAHTACFTGHRDIPQADIAQIAENTKNIVESLIQKGIRYFGNGGAYGYDLLAAEIVLELKQKYPHIRLIIVLPCLDHTAKWHNTAEIDRYKRIAAKADKVTYQTEKYCNGCELARNRRLVDYSDYCICYLTQKSGGTAYTVNYAKQNGLTVCNVAEMAQNS